MSRVARSARVASRQRLELLNGSKTITAAESGELYVVAGASSVTLPAAQDGAYFKFVFGGNVTSATALVLTTADTSTAWAGTVMVIDESANTNAGGLDLSTTQLDRAVTGDAHEVLTIGSTANDILAGSYVECFSDGSNWVATGIVRCDANDGFATFSG